MKVLRVQVEMLVVDEMTDLWLVMVLLVMLVAMRTLVLVLWWW